MEETASSWLFTITVTLCLTALLTRILTKQQNSKSHLPLPPGPRVIPVLGSLTWLGKTSMDIETTVRSLTSKLGPIVTLRIGRRPAIFISGRPLAHRALVHHGATFADRPKPLPAGKVMNGNGRNISSSPYGALWRILRRNISGEILHHSRIGSYSRARGWVLRDVLVERLRKRAEDPESVVEVIEHFRFAMFALLALMCYGDKLDEEQIGRIEVVHRRVLLSFNQFQILNVFPRLTKVLLPGRWKKLFDVKRDLEKVVVPLIRARKDAKSPRMMMVEEKGGKDEMMLDAVVSYVDTLLELEVPPGEGEEEAEGKKRKLTESEMASLCAEFMNAGTDTTSTALQWIMANLVKYPSIQAKLYDEIKGVMTMTTGREDHVAVVEEDDIAKMKYLKAVVLEGLRRHPPAHFVLPHSVTEDMELDGHRVPRNAVVNFMVADIGWDPQTWEDPMAFKPERFMISNSNVDGESEDGGLFDITGTREIKMMPFGVGRRICPGSGLALLHLEYFVANLVWNFEWRAVEGDEVDLSETQEFTSTMKHPLRARISLRNCRS
ncbi:Cytochrome P450 89A2-like protein [Drosera capensis]